MQRVTKRSLNKANLAKSSMMNRIWNAIPTLDFQVADFTLDHVTRQFSTDSINCRLFLNRSTGWEIQINQLPLSITGSLSQWASQLIQQPRAVKSGCQLADRYRETAVRFLTRYNLRNKSVLLAISSHKKRLGEHPNTNHSIQSSCWIFQDTLSNRGDDYVRV
jgi:hypothetical protein